MKTLKFITKNGDYATFEEGGYAHVCLIHWSFRNGVVLKPGNMTIRDESDKIVECITKEEFGARYGVSEMRSGA